MARYFFIKFGLIWGSVLQFFVAIVATLISWDMLRAWKGDAFAFYAVVVLYGLVLANNTFWYLKYSNTI